MESIIAAVISAATTLVVCLVNNRAQHAKTTALLDYKLTQLQKTVEKHNQVIERTYILEGQMIEAQHDIRDLKAYHKPNA